LANFDEDLADDLGGFDATGTKGLIYARRRVAVLESCRIIGKLSTAGRVAVISSRTAIKGDELVVKQLH
jgi:hypothetical protein